jgi:hypothetical protein
MVTSYIRVKEVGEGVVGYKSIPVYFPDDEDYDGIELIDADVLDIVTHACSHLNFASKIIENPNQWIIDDQLWAAGVQRLIPTI